MAINPINFLLGAIPLTVYLAGMLAGFYAKEELSEASKPLHVINMLAILVLTVLSITSSINLLGFIVCVLALILTFISMNKNTTKQTSTKTLLMPVLVVAAALVFLTTYKQGQAHAILGITTILITGAISSAAKFIPDDAIQKKSKKITNKQAKEKRKELCKKILLEATLVLAVSAIVLMATA